MPTLFGARTEARRAGRASRRQRGFTLAIVMLLVLLLAGGVAILFASTQAEIRLTGDEVESVASFYAAETAVATAKDWLRGQAPTIGNSSWQAVLGSGAPQLCARGGLSNFQPWSTPALAPVVYDAARGTSYTFCIRNNALDPSFLGGDGNHVDGDSVVAIEAFGYGPNGQANRISVEVGITASAVLVTDYVQAGGSALKQARGDLRAVNTTRSVRY